MKTILSILAFCLLVNSVSAQNASQKITPAGTWIGTLTCKVKDSCSNSKVYCTVKKVAEPNVFRFSFYQGPDSTGNSWKDIDLLYDYPFQVAVSSSQETHGWNFLVNPDNMMGQLYRSKILFTIDLKRKK